MARVVFVVNEARDGALVLAEKAALVAREASHEAEIVVVPPQGELVLGGRIDLAVSLGGDGTFLRTAAAALAADLPLLGVNFGRLGYLTEVEPAEFTAILLRALRGELRIAERAVVEISVSNGTTGGDRFVRGVTWKAVNEVMVEKTAPGHLVHLTTAIDGIDGPAFKADGVLVATPTGSTAYNFSAGGPVVAPELRVLVVTPVAPHLAMDRSLVLGPDHVVSVTVESDRPAAVVVDGREVGRLSPGEGIVCRVAPTPLRVATFDGRAFATGLRSLIGPFRAT